MVKKNYKKKLKKIYSGTSKKVKKAKKMYGTVSKEFKLETKKLKHDLPISMRNITGRPPTKLKKKADRWLMK